jgi:hypothetical protein
VVIFVVGQILPHELAQEFKQLSDLLVVQSWDEGLDESILREFLQIEHQRFFIHISGEAKSHHPIVAIDKRVLMLCHEKPPCPAYLLFI